MTCSDRRPRCWLAPYRHVDETNADKRSIAGHTSKPASGHKVYPYLLRKLAVIQANQVRETDITYVPMAHGARLRLLGRHRRLVRRRVLAWHGSILLDATFCIEALARHGRPTIFNSLQQRPRLEFHERGVAPRAYRHQHGRKGSLARQRVCIKPRAVDEVLEGAPSAYALVHEARVGISRYLGFCNAVQLHSALGGSTPAQTSFNQAPLAAV